MADFSLRDLWWLQPKGPDNPLPALQLGVNMAQNKAAMDLKERDLANDIARTSLMREEMLYKQQLRTDMVAGNAAVAKTIAGIEDWSDPESLAKVWATVSEYPMTAESKAVQGAEYMHRQAVLAKSKQAELDQKAALAQNVGWVYPEDGSPPYLMDARGGVKLAPFHAGLDTGFSPQETDVGGVHLVQVSPNKWQVIERPVPQGKLTDIEKEDLRFIRKRRQELVDSLPTTAPKVGMFGGNKEAVDTYTSKTNEIAQLTAKEDAIRNAVTARSRATPATAAPKTPRTNEIAAPASPASVAPKPLPPKSELIKGEFYELPSGRWQWDGEKFIK